MRYGLEEWMGEMKTDSASNAENLQAVTQEVRNDGGGDKTSRKLTPKYAWVVALGAALSQVIIIVCNQLYQFNVAYIAVDFGVAATSLAIASSLYGLTYAGCGVIWGSVSDAIGFRKSMTIASCGAGLWCVVFGLLAQNAVSAAILLGLTGCFSSGLSISVIPKLISSWFSPRTRGKGIALGLCGGYLTATAMGVVAPALILNLGWRGCFVFLGCVCMLLSPALYLILRDSPALVGTVPFGTKDGDFVPDTRPRKKTTRDKAQARKNIKRVLSMSITWKFGLIYILWQFMMTAENTYITLALLENGYDLVVAGLVSSTYEICSMLGGILLPILSDKFSRKYILAFSSIVAGSCYCLLFWTFGLGDSTILFISIAIVGFFCSLVSMLQTTVAECFPADVRGTGSGMVGTISLIGRFGGPLIASWFIVSFGSGLSTIYTLFAGGCLIAVGILASIWLPKTGGQYGDPTAKEGACHALKSQAPAGND